MAVLSIRAKKTELGDDARPHEPAAARRWTQLGLRTREILVVMLLTFLVVTTTTLVHLSHVTRLTLEETLRHADLLARQIYGLSARAIARADARDPARALSDDSELRSFLNSVIEYSPQVLYLAITDPSGRVILHTDRGKEGKLLPERPQWNTLVSYNPVRRAYALYAGEEIYEAALSVSLDRQPFAVIKVGIPLTLVKSQLYDSLAQSAILGGLALLAAWAVALGLSSLTLKPIRRLAQEMERLRRGEFDAARDLNPTDDFAKLALQLRLLGQQIHADRAEMLAQSSRYQHMADHLLDGLLFVDAERRLQFANRTAGFILGRRLAEARGTLLKDLLEPDHPVRQLVEQAFDEAASVQTASVKIPTEGDAATECMVSVFPVPGASRKGEGALVLMKDLKSLTVSTRTLGSLIKYSAQVAAVGKASAEVTHEVKNPLNAMAIHLRLLKDQLRGAPESVFKSLDVIQKQIGRLDSVVQSFAQSLRPETTLKPVDLGLLFKEICSLLEAEWRERGVTFELRLDADVPPVAGDEDSLRTAFMNIVLNACQAMPDGGRVTIAVDRRDALVAVTVSDTGTGIKPEDMSQMFRMSFTTKAHGSGIGLPLVRRVVEMHDGDIEVSSRVGHGTTVVIRFATG
jgi:nitrogen-specific signal transduction histidine kinase